jgi:peptidoglycan hydrolase CwlO-like protein
VEQLSESQEYENNIIIKCPLCKKQNIYTSITEIPKNYGLLTLLEQLASKQMIEVDNTGVDELKKIKEMIEKIEEENEEIKRFFAKIETFKEDILSRNMVTIRNLQIH